MMEPDRWEQIERLYHAALEREPDARDAFLDEACAGDEELRREVAGLLACDLPSDSFIQSPAIEIVARAMAAEPHIDASTIFARGQSSHCPNSCLMLALNVRGLPLRHRLPLRLSDALIQPRLQGLVDRQAAVEVLSGFRVRPRWQEVSAKLGSSAMA